MTDIGLFTLDENNFVVFGFRNSERVVSGPEEAIQTVAYAMFTEPGSSTFARNEGGGLLALVGRNIRGIAETRTDAAVAVRKAMDTILRTQNENKTADSTVTDLKLIDVRVEGDSIDLDIRIDLFDGNSFRAQFRV